MKSCFVLGAFAITALTLGAVAEEALKSGPKTGNYIPGPFHPLNVTGFPATAETFNKYLAGAFGPLAPLVAAQYPLDKVADPAYAAGAAASDSGIPNGIGVCPMLVELGSALAKATDAPGRGWHWGAEAHHPELPRGNRVAVGQLAPLEQLMFGPSSHADGQVNLMGALRRSMATTGYSDLKEFQRVEVVVAPYESR